MRPRTMRPTLGWVLLLLGPIASTQDASAQVDCGWPINTSMTLTDDIGPCLGNGLVIGADDVTLDCDGHSISSVAGSYGTWGILINFNRRRVTVQNCVVIGFYYDFWLSGFNNTLTGNTAQGGFRDGFFLDGANEYLLTRNTATLGAGFHLNNSFNNQLIENSCAETLGAGFLLESSSTNRVQGNMVYTHGNGFQVVNGSSLNELVGNISDNNIYGYYDLTSGSGTGGTANIYEGNECSNNELGGSNPMGLCDPQP